MRIYQKLLLVMMVGVNLVLYTGLIRLHQLAMLGGPFSLFEIQEGLALAAPDLGSQPLPTLAASPTHWANAISLPTLSVLQSNPTASPAMGLPQASPTPLPTYTPTPMGTLWPNVTLAPSPTPTPSATALPVEAVVATRAPLPTHIPDASGEGEAGVSNVFVEFLLESSARMGEAMPGGSTWGEAAQRLLAGSLLTYRPETNVGLRMFGHRLPWQGREGESCMDVELVAPVAPGYQTETATWLGLGQTLGLAPLSNAIILGAVDYTPAPGRSNSMVVISHSGDTCAGDPCALIDTLLGYGVDVRFFTIGFGVDEAAREELQCIAQKGGGEYYDAPTGQDLAAALETVRQEIVSDEVITRPQSETTSADQIDYDDEKGCGEYG
jgi:hypothetical protein